MYNAKVNNKDYYFFRNSRVSCCLCNNLEPNNLQSNLLQYDSFIFQMLSQHKVHKNLFYSSERYPTWIMVTPHVLYTSHEIYLLSKFVEIDKVSVTLLQSYNKSRCHKLSTFQEISTFYISSCQLINLPRCICSCVCICWLYWFACSAYCSVYK